MSGGSSGRGPGLREVLLVAGLLLVAILGLEAVSTVVPAVHDAFGSFPVTALALVAGTVVVLALVLLRRPTGPRG